jgi:hydrogenase maturation protease
VKKSPVTSAPKNESASEQFLRSAGAGGHSRPSAPAHIALVGLQPVQLDDYGGSLTDIARAQLPAAEQAALTQLAAWGIVPQTNDETRCLNYECLSMENYEGVRIRQYRVTLER